jgi:hypothetical protein
LKPTWPDDDQEITAPDGSVIEMIVLLKVDLMKALPTATFFFSFLRIFTLPLPAAAVFVLGAAIT